MSFYSRRGDRLVRITEPAAIELKRDDPKWDIENPRFYWRDPHVVNGMWRGPFVSEEFAVLDAESSMHELVK